VIFVYVLFFVLTFFPSIGSRYIFLLIDYPSITLILLGWIVVIVLTISWRHRIPSLFQWLWEREQANQKDRDLKGEFTRYLQEYQSALLSRKGPQIIAFILSVLVALFILAAGMPSFISIYFSRQAIILIYLIFLIILIWVLMIGFLCWVLYVTGRFVRELTKRFAVAIQPTHPDGCGGLKPLGDFCFNIAFALIGGGLVLAIVPMLNWDRDDALSVFSMIIIFVVIGPLTVLAVFSPLWGIHNKMVEHKKSYQDAFAVQLSELEQAMHANTRKAGNLAEAKDAREKLEILQTLHPDKLAYPTWPFKFTRTVIAILSPQILQTAVGIVTSVYEVFF
jgi:hypothetical protein